MGTDGMRCVRVWRHMPVRPGVSMKFEFPRGKQLNCKANLGEMNGGIGELALRPTRPGGHYRRSRGGQTDHLEPPVTQHR